MRRRVNGTTDTGWSPNQCVVLLQTDEKYNHSTEWFVYIAEHSFISYLNFSV